jgi:hypothetical protein
MALTTVDQGLLGQYAQYTGFKNRIINGAMVIDQRNAGASVTVTTSNPYTLDRWQAICGISSKFTVQQTPSATETGYATRIAAGFTNYLACTSSAATSVGSGDYYLIRQTVEGLNCSDLAWGTANAKPVTLSFWVYSSLTGTFGGALGNSSNTRAYPFTYTISAANTWEQKTVTIAGDTTGTWLTTNGVGIKITFVLGLGSTYTAAAGSWAAGEYYGATGETNVVSTNGATFYITGVQLEKGSTATSFDYRPYGTELALCQRYYWKKVGGANASSYETIGSGFVYNTTTNARVQIQYPCPMRAIPTFSTNGTLYMGVGAGNLTPSTITSYAGLNSALADITITASTVGFSTIYYTSNTTSDYFQASAEL